VQYITPCPFRLSLLFHTKEPTTAPGNDVAVKMTSTSRPTSLLIESIKTQKSVNACVQNIQCSTLTARKD